MVQNIFAAVAVPGDIPVLSENRAYLFLHRIKAWFLCQIKHRLFDKIYKSILMILLYRKGGDMTISDKSIISGVYFEVS